MRYFDVKSNSWFTVQAHVSQPRPRRHPLLWQGVIYNGRAGPPNGIHVKPGEVMDWNPRAVSGSTWKVCLKQAANLQLSYGLATGRRRRQCLNTGPSYIVGQVP
jgi:hypothetical protein